jgi:hypothetical protein
MSKSLGQIAFEARLLHEDGFILPNEWAACAEEHAAWQAAAEAVLVAADMEVQKRVVEAVSVLMRLDYEATIAALEALEKVVP